MKPAEKVAVLTALQKMVKAELDVARREADDDLLAAFDEDGVTKRALKVGGFKVGDHIVVLNSGQWSISDREAFEEFALSYGFATVERTIRPEWMARAIDLVAEEDPAGIEEHVKLDPKWQDYVANVAGTATYLDSGMAVPGLTFTGQTVKNTQVRGCKPEDVAPIIRQLGGIDALLLPEQTQPFSLEEA